MTDSILITGCTVLPGPSAPLLSDRYVAAAGGVITATGPMTACPRHRFARTIDGTGRLLMPGLVNCHNHCAMTLFRGLADDLALTTWLQEHIFPAEAAQVNPEMVYWCSKLAAAEMILSGTTSVADGYFHSGRAFEALHDAGMRAVVAHGIVDFPAPSVPDPAKNIEAVRLFLERYRGRSERVLPAVFAHAPYTCSPQTLRKAKDLADANGVRFFIHLAESAAEPTMIIDPQGPTPVTHLAALGILDRNCVCIHSVWLDDRDLDTLAASGAAVVTCPQSNLKLASGIARIPEMLERSIPVGLGTDGCASNNSLDLFREMDLLAKIQKAAGEATAMPARAVLASATSTGAGILGLDRCGVVEAGARADLIMIDLNRPHLTPFFNQDLLVYAATGSDVVTVIIDGVLVMQDRRILSFDLEEVYDEVEKRATLLRPDTAGLSR